MNASNQQIGGISLDAGNVLAVIEMYRNREDGGYDTTRWEGSLTALLSEDDGGNIGYEAVAAALDQNPDGSGGEQTGWCPETTRIVIPVNDVVRAERENIANELEKYMNDMLESRGIARPTWIGRNELQQFIDGLRDTGSTASNT